MRKLVVCFKSTGVKIDPAVSKAASRLVRQLQSCKSAIGVEIKMFGETEKVTEFIKSCPGIGSCVGLVPFSRNDKGILYREADIVADAGLLISGAQRVLHQKVTTDFFVLSTVLSQKVNASSIYHSFAVIKAADKNLPKNTSAAIHILSNFGFRPSRFCSKKGKIYLEVKCHHTDKEFSKCFKVFRQRFHDVKVLGSYKIPE